MTTNNPTKTSVWRFFSTFFSKMLKKFFQNLTNFSLKYPNLSEIIQLSFISYFAVIDLTYAILSSVFSLGYFPEVLKEYYLPVRGILSNPFFQMWNSPEKIFFLSYLAIELIVIRPVFKFSKLVKYNVLLIFALLMMQGLLISYWDLIFHREIASSVTKWIFDESGLIYTDKYLSIIVFLLTFLSFLTIYGYLYVSALKGEFATLPRGTWLTDSVAFWLKLKTPTMRLGRKDNNKDED